MAEGFCFLFLFLFFLSLIILKIHPGHNSMLETWYMAHFFFADLILNILNYSGKSMILKQAFVFVLKVNVLKL